MPKRRPSRPKTARGPQPRVDTALRIIGGKHRGRKLEYSGDPLTRPMKDRVREAAFNLIGPAVKDALAVDLFAGTGALALEALSRGAAEAVLVERHFPTARIIRRNAAVLDVESVVTVLSVDSFYFVRHRLDELTLDRPWIVFFSPPYALYEEQAEAMREQIARVQQAAPAGSLLLAEFDTRFASSTLPGDGWDVRPYSPAILARWQG